MLLLNVRFRPIADISLSEMLLAVPPALHQDSSAPARLLRFACDGESRLLIGANRARIVRVWISADHGRVRRKQTVAVFPDESCAVAATEHLRLTNILVDSSRSGRQM